MMDWIGDWEGWFKWVVEEHVYYPGPNFEQHRSYIPGGKWARLCGYRDWNTFINFSLFANISLLTPRIPEIYI